MSKCNCDEAKMALQKTDLTPLTGTEIKADIATLVSGEHAAEIIELLEQRGMLVVREIHMSDTEQEAFSRTLGGVQSQFGSPIQKISIDKNETFAADYLRGSFFWHIDGSTDDRPNFAATLNAKVLSKTGGTTYFANTYAAYEALPEDEKKLYDSMRVVHSMEVSQRYIIPEPGAEELALWQQRVPKTHPLVWHHRSGRKSLVLGSTADYIEGIGFPEGRMILAKLRDWATQPQFVVSHDWTVGDLLIWDNSGTMHRVDEYPVEDGRMLHRTTIDAREELVGG
jgi:alpha-ketoglutarate-dependent taurine dioxygenase